jgi:hypothetical protein
MTENRLTLLHSVILHEKDNLVHLSHHPSIGYYFKSKISGNYDKIVAGPSDNSIIFVDRGESGIYYLENKKSRKFSMKFNSIFPVSKGKYLAVKEGLCYDLSFEKGIEKVKRLFKVDGYILEVLKLDNDYYLATVYHNHITKVLLIKNNKIIEEEEVQKFVIRVTNQVFIANRQIWEISNGKIKKGNVILPSGDDDYDFLEYTVLNSSKLSIHCYEYDRKLYGEIRIYSLLDMNLLQTIKHTGSPVSLNEHQFLTLDPVMLLIWTWHEKDELYYQSLIQHHDSSSHISLLSPSREGITELIQLSLFIPKVLIDLAVEFL